MKWWGVHYIYILFFTIVQIYWLTYVIWLQSIPSQIKDKKLYLFAYFRHCFSAVDVFLLFHVLTPIFFFLPRMFSWIWSPKLVCRLVVCLTCVFTALLVWHLSRHPLVFCREPNKAVGLSVRILRLWEVDQKKKRKKKITKCLWICGKDPLSPYKAK